MRKGASPCGEVIVPLASACRSVTSVRTTLLLSSLASLTEAGFGDAYLRCLPVQYHETVRTFVAGSWIPLEVAIAHYEACTSLGLSHESVVRLGRSVSAKLSGTLLGTAARISKEMGISPVEIIAQFPRFMGRAFQGGGCCAFRMGPKEVRVEAHQIALFDYAYFRSSACGLLMAVLEPLCTRIYVTEIAGARAAGCAFFRLQWA